MAHAIEHNDRQLDTNRIVGTAGAIAVNVALLMVLMVPMAVPQLDEKLQEMTVFPTFDPPKKLDPPPPPKPVDVKIEQPKPRQITQPVQQQIELPPQPVVDPVDTDSLYVPEAPPQPETFARADLGRGDILTGAALQVVNNPAPTYPGEAVRNQLTGTVMLEILVGIDGKPLEVTVVKSSGHRVLDQAAKRVVLQRWTFQPAMQAGQAVQARGRVPIEFTLDR